MPIFEYICTKCNSKFEKLLRGTTDVECPLCKSRKVEKQLSVFSASTARVDRPQELLRGACGACGDPRGPGSCARN
ncbi:MAG: zinc ribbon domain-containing protein [Pyrinomonadaceae bacterium]